jgi:sugar-phosphatase
MVEAVFFDMDGLMIDTEPFWMEEERNLFKSLGVPVTPELQIKTYGWGTDEVIQYWYNYKPWENFDPDNIKEKIYSRIEHRIREEGETMPGLDYVLNFFKKKNLPVGLVSTSPMQIINAFLDKFGLGSFFNIVHSCEFERYNKPHPAVYINAAGQLGIDPANCLVFEDSFVGLIASLAARMKVVCVPCAGHLHEEKYNIADIKILQLDEFTERHFDELNKTTIL